MQSNNPIKSFKAGAVKASVFKNKYQRQGVVATIYRVVLDRSYKDRDGNWKSTNSFTAERDLPKAILVLQKAFEFLTFKDSNGLESDS